MSLPGQVGIGLRAKRSTQRRMRSFSQWRTDVHGQSTGGALHANGKRFISLDDRSGRGAVNFRELPMRGHHLSLWSLFCIPSFQLRQRYFIENVGCDRRSRFESWYHVEICIHVEFEIGKVSFKLGKVEKETRSPSFGIFVSRIFFKVNNSFFHLNSKQRISRLDQSTRSKYTSDRMQNTLQILVRDSKFFQWTTTPYRVSKSYNEDCFSSTAAIRCWGRFVAIEGGGCGRKNKTSSGIKSKLSLLEESSKERDTGNGKRERERKRERAVGQEGWNKKNEKRLRRGRRKKRLDGWLFSPIKFPEWLELH